MVFAFGFGTFCLKAEFLVTKKISLIPSTFFYEEYFTKALDAKGFSSL